MRLTMRVRTHKYRFVCACTCDYLSEARERTLRDYSLSSALIETYVILNAYSVILNAVNVAIKPSAEQVHLLCRGGARSRNSRISRSPWRWTAVQALRSFVTLRMTLRGDASTSLSITLLVSLPTLTPKSHCHNVTMSHCHRGWG